MGEMRDKSDAQLLSEYAEHRNEAAFSEIVARHTDLVYSAALRQVVSAHLARDITQSVFTDLARKARPLAGKLQQNASLAGWLYRSTRFAVLNQLRDDRRRLTHERQVMEQLLANSEPAPDWDRIRPILDEAMDALKEEDREAVLLRYFKNHELRAVGLALGVSEDAAQKRVSRAVERLREFFAKRGVTIGAGGLAAVITGNAVQAAPIGLATAISTAAVAGAGLTSTATIALTKVIAMTTLQKSLILATVIAGVGSGVFEAHQATALRTQTESLRKQKAELSNQVHQLQQERDDATNRLAGLLAENEQLRTNSNQAELLRLRGQLSQLQQADAESNESGSRQALMKSWIAREDKLRQIVMENPDKSIPELQLLSEQDWLDVARDAKFGSDKDERRSLANLRNKAEGVFAQETHDAVAQYMKANDGQFPTNMVQLEPYYQTSVSSSILDRWEVAPHTAIPNIGVGDWVITQKQPPIDSELDQHWAVGPHGLGEASYGSSDAAKALAALAPALKAYSDANSGNHPNDPSQLLPYLTTPEQKAALQTLMAKSPDQNSASQVGY